MKNQLGIELMSVFGLPPVDYVNLAADLGCTNISVGLFAFELNPHGYPSLALREHPNLRREMAATMRDRGVRISLAEGLLVRPGVEAADYASDFDIFVELGATRANFVSVDPDLSRTFDQFALLAGMAAERGMVSTLEPAPGLTVADVPTALAAIRHVGRPDFRLLVDAMHVIRSGSTPAKLAELDPGLIGYIQLCDVPLKPKIESYMEEAMTARLIPGNGELPLLELLQALPRNLVISLEIPMLADATAGIGPYDRLRPAVAATKALLAQLDNA